MPSPGEAACSLADNAASPEPRSRDAFYAGLLAAVVSVIALTFYYLHNEVLLYGDAIAHINIARRLFDSRTPGPFQLGTVWLPLPHLLMAPFLASNWLWRTGLGGSIPSMIAYVVSAAGIYRLVWRGLSTLLPDPARTAQVRIAAWLAVAIYAGNPSLIYLQSTALTEPLYLAFFIWAAVFFSEYCLNPQDESLMKCGALLFCCSLIRYDGWFAAPVFAAAGLVAAIRRFRPKQTAQQKKALVAFLLLVVLGPVLWLGWNTFYYGNPLEFANGPYSAKAIAERMAHLSEPLYPGRHSVPVAARYYIKSAKLMLAGGSLKREYPDTQTRLQNSWFPLAAAGMLLLVILARPLWAWLLLWLPLAFYSLTTAYGSVPICVPSWWPFSFYNMRYAAELLPAVAVFTAVAVYLVTLRIPRAARIIVLLAVVAFVAASYWSVWRNTPSSLREAQVNSASKLVLEKELALELRKLPPDSVLLMCLVDHVGSLQQAGIPLRRTINEENRRIWESALRNPANWADYAVATDGDPVAKAVSMHGKRFEAVARIEYGSQKPMTIYRRR